MADPAPGKITGLLIYCSQHPSQMTPNDLATRRKRLHDESSKSGLQRKIGALLIERGRGLPWGAGAEVGDGRGALPALERRRQLLQAWRTQHHVGGMAPRVTEMHSPCGGTVAEFRV